MFKESTLAFSIFCLSIAIIISAVIVGNGIKRNGEYINTGLYNSSGRVVSVGNNTDTNTESVVYKRNTYNFATASGYLGISESQLMSIISSKDSNIPYIRIGSEYVFSKLALDKWLETARIEIK